MEKGSEIILTHCLNVKPTEKVLIVADDDTFEIGMALYNKAKSITSRAFIVIMEMNRIHGREPDDIVAKAMLEADVIICPTTASISHTNARIEACRNGARIATMPCITKDMFSQGPITANYKQVAELSKKISDILTVGNQAIIKKGPYVLKMSLKGRDGHASTGIYHNPCDFGNLPTGEAYIAPLEGTAFGEMEIDGSMVGIGKIDSPLKVTLKDGLLTSIQGEKAENLDILLKNEFNANLAELGIGTNDKARLTGNVLEDEKIYGTVHIAFGSNTSFGGTVKADCHMDGVILKPDLFIDDIQILKDGRFINI